MSTDNKQLREQIRKLVNDTRINYAYPEATPPEEYEEILKAGIYRLVEAHLAEAERDFIESLIVEVGELKPNNELTHMSIVEQHGYEQALTTVKDLLKSKLKEQP